MFSRNICKDCEHMVVWDSDFMGKSRCKLKDKYVPQAMEACNYFKTADDLDIRIKTDRIMNDNDEGGCYITTVLCKILNYPDDCEYMENLRKVRDNYMKKEKKYAALLNEYDEIGPQLSQNIFEDNDKENVAQYLVEEFLKPALKEIKQDNNENAIIIYTSMLLYLKNKYKFKK